MDIDNIPATPLTKANSMPLPYSRRRRHDKLWFDDGTIVLATPQVIFRVYRGTLARHSPIFHDLFALAQPTNPNGSEDDTVDGIPVVELQDDPVELAHLLNTLHDRSYYFHLESRPMSQVAAILRLSTKYQIAVLRRYALADLATIYPDTLDRFEKLESIHTSESMVTEISHIDAINLAREVDAPAILPAAFYRVARLLVRCETENTPDGMMVYLAKLSDADKLRVYYGREKLRELLVDKVGGVLCKRPSAACQHIPTCDMAKLSLLRGLGGAWRHWSKVGDIFIKWRYDACSEFLSELCPTCTLEWHTSIAECRRKAWDNLPLYFGLGDWETLRRTMRMQEAAYAMFR